MTKDALTQEGSHENLVAINFLAAEHYPSTVPFDPAERYPEYAGTSIDPTNPIYGGVRETLHRAGLDHQNWGTPAWNPLADLVEPGMTVFLKPNTVRHFHVRGEDVLSVIVHASVLRPILDYLCRALGDRGRVIIGDSQVVFADFEKTYLVSQIADLVAWYRTQTPVSIECFDLRMNRGARTWLFGRWARKKVEQDPRGYRLVNLGDRSYFRGIDPTRLRIGIASYRSMLKHHSNGRHEYLIPQSVLDSDVVISVAKLKTHRRTAVTLAIKNFMGVPASKESLAHFTVGSPEEGGDQYIYPSLRKRVCTRLHDRIQSSRFVPVKFANAVVKRLLWDTRYLIPFKDDVYEAMWYGNDTLWRTLGDINRVVLYADKEGAIRETPQRRFFGLVDGILAGERDGPISVDPVPAGLLLAGFNPVAMDVVATTMMGFDFEHIPMIRKLVETDAQPLPLFSGSIDDIQVVADKEILHLEELKRRHNLEFEPHPSWKGHVELGVSGRPARDVSAVRDFVRTCEPAASRTRDGSSASRFAVSRRTCSIYLLDLDGPAPSVEVPRQFALEVIDQDNQQAIRQIEDMEEALAGKVASMLATGSLCLVGLDGDTVGGFCLVSFGRVLVPEVRLYRTCGPDEAWSEHLAVNERYRDRGLATLLCLGVGSRLRQRGVRRLYGAALPEEAAGLAACAEGGLRFVADVRYQTWFGRESWSVKRVAT